MTGTKVKANVPATYRGVHGKIVAIQQESVWWVADGCTEKRYFSYRRDGVWREFPGRVDGPGLEINSKRFKKNT